MRFHIRYEQNEACHTAEIEANSPHEAVVKFEQVKGSRTCCRGDDPRVTSVNALDATGELS